MSVLSTPCLFCDDQPDSHRKPPSSSSHVFFVASNSAFAGTIDFHYESNSWKNRYVWSISKLAIVRWELEDPVNRETPLDALQYACGALPNHYRDAF
ncbi:hypothetical protein OUZ56_028548 [Daphnia magna]|uniref:Uncharacterized protein n=1 Tax=Daphnia magna TaxID=35525 RepID=A0ABR0B4B9_9CRUS|nr:hypothetical protein OUZ56_028548 [Daphnia magna]